MTYFALIKTLPYISVIKPGVEVLVNGEHMLMISYSCHVKFHKMKNDRSGFLKKSVAAKNTDDVSLVEEHLKIL